MYYSSYGSFMHKLIERYYKGEINREQMKVEFLTGFSKEVRGDRPSEKVVSSYISDGQKFIDTFVDIPYNILDVEKRLEFSICGKKWVGVIDIIGEKDGELYIIDNKSRALKPRSKRKKPTGNDRDLDEMLKQLYVYAAAVEQAYGKLPKALCFNCFRNNTFIEEPFDADIYESVISEFTNMINRIEGSELEDFYPRIDYFYCNYLCGFSHECEYCSNI